MCVWNLSSSGWKDYRALLQAIGNAINRDRISLQLASSSNSQSLSLSLLNAGIVGVYHYLGLVVSRVS